MILQRVIWLIRLHALRPRFAPSNRKAANGCASTRCSRHCMRTGSPPLRRNGTGVPGPPTGARAIQFHVFAQWLAARSFAAAQEAAHTVGMRIGLIADLAVGMSPAGSHAW